MRNSIKWNAIRRIAGIIAFVAVIGFSFAACGEGQGQDGTDGKDGLDGGGGRGVMVWDSSTPPKLVGAFLERTTAGSVTTFTVLLPSGYIVPSINSSTAVITPIRIECPSDNFTGGLYVKVDTTWSLPKTVYYNPHFGGTGYRLTDGYPNDTIPESLSYYDATGQGNFGGITQGPFHKVQKIAENDILNSLTPPLVLKMTE